MRFGAVAYRDFDVDKYMPTLFLPLCPPAEASRSAEKVVEFMKTFTAGGGDDGPEDVAGGLLKAASLIREGGGQAQQHSLPHL